MWPGRYGEFGSRKYLLASLDQSLKRLGVDYVDIFYSHRFDPATPLYETMQALDAIVRQGKALYVGISSYNARRTREATEILERLGTPCLIHQPSYSMLNRWPENNHLLDQLEESGMDCIAFSALAQGLLTARYLVDIRPTAAPPPVVPLLPELVTDALRTRLRAFDAIARRRGQSLAQMAIAWVLRDSRVTSALIGASRVEQIDDCLKALDRLAFAEDELEEIDGHAVDYGIKLWAQSSEFEGEGVSV